MTIDWALKETIKYAKKYKSYLNKDEIDKRLISNEVFSKKTISEIIGRIEDKKDKYYQDKFIKGGKLAKEIEKHFGDILFLGISGSVASGHPKKNDDIDFLVITKQNRLWRTRLFLRLWVFIKKIPHRKYGKQGERDEFCFNLWLDDSNLLIPKNRRILKNAVDLVLLKPLINKNQTYEKFILANNWAKKWVATPYFNKIQDIRSKMLDKKMKQNNFLDKITNYLYFWPQYWYMKRKISGERVGLDEAFFHEPMVK